MSNQVPGDYLRDRAEFTEDDIADDDNLLIEDQSEAVGSKLKRWAGTRLKAWIVRRINAVVHPWARAATPPSGSAGEAGNFERTIFRVQDTRPAIPTAPATVARAGVDPLVPAGWTDGGDWAGGTPPGDTPVWASLQRVNRGETAVSYTYPIRWDGPDGMDAAEDADFVEDIRRRLDRQEFLTSEIGESVRTGWAEAPTPATAAIFLVLRTGEVTLSTFPNYTWATRLTVASDDDWQVLLRLPTGRKPTSIEVTRVASDGGARPTLAGHWAFQFTQEGYSYWSWHQPNLDDPTGWHGWVDLDSGDVLTVQVTTSVEGTDWLGDVRALTFHESKPWAHHDSPARVSDLGIGAPVGREVYLTREIRHPAPEQMHSVTPGILSEITGSFVCHTLGVGEAGFNLLNDSLLPDQSPAAQRLAVVADGDGILATTRIAALYQVAGNGSAYIYLPLAMDPAIPAPHEPWKLHLKLGDGAWTEYSLHVSRTAQPSQITIAGVVYQGWQTGNFGYVGQPSGPGAGAFETLAGAVNSYLHVRLEYNAEPNHRARRWLQRDGVAAGIYGASIVDLSSGGGPVRAGDVSGYPGVMNANRVAAIWQEEGQGTIRVTVRGDIGTPTRFHVGGLPDAAGEHTWALVQDVTRTVGGVEYRFMYAEGAVVPAELQAMAFAGSALRFSLGYGDPNLLSYLAADGSLVAGSVQSVGAYTSNGDGTWTPSIDAIADELGISDVVSMPMLSTNLSAAGAGGGLRVGDEIGNSYGAVHQTLDSAESTENYGTYLVVNPGGLTVDAQRDGTVLVNAFFYYRGTESNNKRNAIHVRLSRNRGGVITTRRIRVEYSQSDQQGGSGFGGSRQHQVGINASISILVQNGDSYSIDLGQNVVSAYTNPPALAEGRMQYVYLGAIRGEAGEDGQNVRVLRETSASALPTIRFQPGSISSVIRVILTYRERHQSVRAAAPQNINLYRGGTPLKQRLATLTPDWAEALPLMAVDQPATTSAVTYGVSTQFAQSTPGDVRNYSDFELVILDYGAAPAPPLADASPSVPYSRQRTFYRWQQDSITAPPAFAGATWASGNFYNVPAGWSENAPAVVVPGHALWIALATADQNGSVSAVVTRVVDGWNVRWYEGDSAGSASSPTYVEGTHHYYRLRQVNGLWGPIQPINPEGEDQLGWANLYEHTGVWHTDLHANPLAPTIDLANWTEVAWEVLAHGFGDVAAQGYHWRGMTVPLPTAAIGPLAAHDVETPARPHTMFISFGGTSRANHLGLGGPGINASFPQYDGIELQCILRRTAAADADTRIVSSLVFTARGGGYSGSGDNVTLRLRGR